MFQKLAPLLRLNILKRCQLGLHGIKFPLRLCNLLKQFQITVSIVVLTVLNVPRGIDGLLQGLPVGLCGGNLLLHGRPIVLHQLSRLILDELNGALNGLELIARFVNGPIERRVLVQ